MAETDAGHDDRGPGIAGAGGVVFNRRGEVLVIRYRDGSWVFPKGHLDDGEVPLDAALREVAEEAGVTARCPDPQLSFVTRYLNDRGERRVITWFRLETDDDAPVMREALLPEGAFVPTDEALERLSYPEDRNLLRAVLEAAPA